jgi:hypothetical protein
MQKCISPATFNIMAQIRNRPKNCFEEMENNDVDESDCTLLKGEYFIGILIFIFYGLLGDVTIMIDCWRTRKFAFY